MGLLGECFTYDGPSDFRSLMAVLLFLKSSKTVPMSFRSEVSSVKLRREYTRDEVKAKKSAVKDIGVKGGRIQHVYSATYSGFGKDDDRKLPGVHNKTN